MYLLLNFSVQAKYNETTATTSNFFSNVCIKGKYFLKNPTSPLQKWWWGGGVINSPIFYKIDKTGVK